MKTQKLKYWSFSGYSTYSQCPLKAKLNQIDKIKEPGNSAMMRGSEIHDKAERYIKGEGRNLPPELKRFGDLFKRLRKQYKTDRETMCVEDTWAFTRDWSETQWNDWVGCWLRVKLDLAEHEGETCLRIRDWKTGKYRPDQNDKYVEQLELYALAALLLHEHIETVKPCLIYLDHGITYPEPDTVEEDELTFTRADIPRLKKLWDKRVRPMFNDTTFAARPNRFCGWCFYRKSNLQNGGGQCEYG